MIQRSGEHLAIHELAKFIIGDFVHLSICIFLSFGALWIFHFSQELSSKNKLSKKDDYWTDY